MKIAWKPTLFVLANLVFVVILASLLLLIIEVYNRSSDLMSLILIFSASLAFLVIGICLFILGKSFPISLLNKLLPFISVPALIVSTGFTSSRGLLPGMLITAALIVLAIFTTATSLIRHRGKVIAGVIIKEQELPAQRGIASFTRWGALGFGFGALVGSLPAWALTLTAFVGRPVIVPVGTKIPLFVEYAVMGGIAGALIGGLALKNPRKAWQLTLAGALGFGLGSILPYLTALVPAKAGIPYGVVSGAIMGAVGGAALGLALKHWRKAAFLALTGAASFAVTHEILKSVLFPRGIAYFELQTVLVFPVEAAIVGAALGAVLGYLEKGKANSPVP